MIDIKYIKENPEEVIARYAIKGKDAREEITRILELDAQRRALIVEGESLKAEQNKTNKLIPQYKKEGRDVAPIFAELKEIANKTKAIDEQLRAVEGEYNALMMPYIYTDLEHFWEVHGGEIGMNILRGEVMANAGLYGLTY